MGRHSHPATDWNEVRGLLIERATAENYLARARWVLTHCDARTALQSTPLLYRHPMVQGFTELAALLVAHGAERVSLTNDEAFRVAATRLDRAALEALLEKDASLARSPSALFVAAQHNRFEMATLLLDLGVSPDVRSHSKMRPLHVAASSGATNVAALLIARGAEIDPIETHYGSAPIGGANWHRRPGTLALLAQPSRAMFPLVQSGQVARVRQLLDEDPSLATLVRERDGHTLLMVLPGDEALAIEMADVLLAHGADPSPRDADGLTTREVALRRGFLDLADLIAEFESRRI